jgi:dihydroxyacetone kinase-like predicted kinase
VRDSTAECGPISEGDWLVIGPTGIGATAASAAEAACALVDRLIDEDSEIVTVLVGIDARAPETQRVREHLATRHPHVEIEVHEGGQPLYPYLIGVE